VRSVFSSYTFDSVAQCSCSPATGTYITRGRVIKELGLRRTDLVISTKIFFGVRKGPNDDGLSRKQYVATNFPKFSSVLNRKIFSIIEGAQESLARLGLDYVDIIFAHRPDPSGMLRSNNKCYF
jgi:aryl-alcohol dehydrogenase-like predicted oxidoreductase